MLLQPGGVATQEGEQLWRVLDGAVRRLVLGEEQLEQIAQLLLGRLSRAGVEPSARVTDCSRQPSERRRSTRGLRHDLGHFSRQLEARMLHG